MTIAFTGRAGHEYPSRRERGRERGREGGREGRRGREGGKEGGSYRASIYKQVNSNLLQPRRRGRERELYLEGDLTTHPIVQHVTEQL